MTTKAELTVSGTTIYRAEERLFVTQNDHNLVEITGGDVPLLDCILRGVQAGQSVETIAGELLLDFQVGDDYTGQLVDWLVESGVLQRGAGLAAEFVERVTYLFAPSLSLSDKEQVCRYLSDDRLTISLTDSIESADLVLFMSPILEHLTVFEDVNRKAYEAGLVSCHFSADVQTFTVGPLSVPAMQTPCLHCYMQRKLINRQNLSQTLQFIRHSGSEIISHSSPANSPVFQTGLAYLRHELTRALSSNPVQSVLIGCSALYDTRQHTVQQSRILKMPFCPVCSQRTPFYAAFNG